jgi:hypothetical protein
MRKYDATDTEIEALNLAQARPPAPNPYRDVTDFSQEDYVEDN